MEGKGTVQVHEVSVENQAFQQAKVRIEKSQRIKADLQSKKAGEALPPTYQQRLEEIRGLELEAEQGEEGKLKGNEEQVMDIRGYEEKRVRIDFKGPSGEPLSEEVVMFFKLGTDGQPVILSNQVGRPWTLNADLYDSRQASQLHPTGIDYASKVLPRVDGQGKYIGVVSILEDKPDQSQPDPLDLAPQKIREGNPPPQTVPDAEPAKELDLLADLQPVLDKLKTQVGDQDTFIGKEVTLSAEEVALIHQVIDTARDALIKIYPEINDVYQLVDQLRKSDPWGFGMNYVMDNAVANTIVRDDTINQVVVIERNGNTPGEIRLPGNLFGPFMCDRDIKEKVGKALEVAEGKGTEKVTSATLLGKRLENDLGYIQQLVKSKLPTSVP